MIQPVSAADRSALAMTTGNHRFVATPRRVLAVVALAWLNLLVQPCLAELPLVTAGMEQCDHDGGPHHEQPCPEMRAVDCEAPADLAGTAPQGDGAARTGALLTLLPVAGPGQHVTTGPPDPGNATPIHIRFCNLRN